MLTIVSILLIALFSLLQIKPFIYHTIGCWPNYGDTLINLARLGIMVSILIAAYPLSKRYNFSSITNYLLGLFLSCFIAIFILILVNVLFVFTPFGNYFLMGFIIC